MVDVGSAEYWDALALEFSDAGRMTIFSVPVQEGDYPPFRTIALWRWFERPEVFWGTREKERHLRGLTDEPLISPIQMWVHGLIVKGAKVDPMPNRMQGQNVDIELSEGITLHLRTRRRAETLDPKTGEYAAFELGLSRKRGPLIVMPGWTSFTSST